MRIRVLSIAEQLWFMRNGLIQVSCRSDELSDELDAYPFAAFPRPRSGPRRRT